MKLPVGWLREFADPPEEVAQIAARMASCGFAVDGIDQDVIDFEVTANRPDCLSIRGLAREVSTVYDVPFSAAAKAAPSSGATGPAATGGTVPLDATVPVRLDTDACGRYALAVADVRIAPSPAWLTDRLNACGVRPINNVVDVTNYVMLELGHPLHAFDLATLAGQEIVVRPAKTDESLTTLDGETRKLSASMTVIADRDRAVAVAGVMGGRATEVTGSTRRVAIESAWFRPGSVRAAAKKLGLKTEASMRFERGADIGAAAAALERALGLLVDIGAAERVGRVHDTYPRPAVPRSVDLDRAHLTRLLGARVDDADVSRILTALGFDPRPVAAGWRTLVPTWRVDVAREADLIEEVGRHWGFDRIPPTFPALGTEPEPAAAGVIAGRDLRRILCAAGLQEAVTFTFVERAAAAPFVTDEGELVAIANPLSEKFGVLRPSLLAGLVDACVYNQRRQQPTIRLFETGAVFLPSGERQHVGWALSGLREEHWSRSASPIDFFDASGVAELIGAAFGLALRFERADDAIWCVPGRAARVFAAATTGSHPIGVIGQVRPAIVSARGGGAEAVVAGVLDVAPLIQARASTPAGVSPLPRFPSIVRDLSLLLDERLPAETVRGTIRANAASTLDDVREFDRYQGKGVPDGQISLSVRLTFRHADRTLTDQEVQQAVDAIVAALGRAHGATLRA